MSMKNKVVDYKRGDSLSQAAWRITSDNPGTPEVTSGPTAFSWYSFHWYEKAVHPEVCINLRS